MHHGMVLGHEADADPGRRAEVPPHGCDELLRATMDDNMSGDDDIYSGYSPLGQLAGTRDRFAVSACSWPPATRPLARSEAHGRPIDAQPCQSTLAKTSRRPMFHRLSDDTHH